VEIIKERSRSPRSEKDIKCLYNGKGSRSSCTNYRLMYMYVSIISSTAKLLEYIIYKRLSLNLGKDRIVKRKPTAFGTANDSEK
jgi:hypothetical protein